MGFLTLRRRPPRPTAADIALMSELSAATTVQALPGTHAALWLMALFVAAALAWAATAPVELLTRAEGRVVPAGREQVIASLEGGILRELLVREGMAVEPGQELALLDPTRFEAQQNEGQAKRLALVATAARLRAESAGTSLAFPPELEAQPVFKRHETDAYRARQRGLDEAVRSTRRSVELLARELRTAQSMSAQGLMSEVEVLRLQRQVNELELQAEERVNRFRQDASVELARVNAELAQLAEQIQGRADVLRRTVLRSPVRGLVKNIRTSTQGGVIAPGAAVMEIVPVEDRIVVEARIRPADIGFVRVGQPAQVKLSAYDFHTYGGLQGHIEHVSPDALGDPERAPGSAEATWYRATVRADHSTLRAAGEPLPVRPGMTGTVEVRTGERSVLSFLLRPLLRVDEAFTER